MLPFAEGGPNIHRDQAIVERFNRTLAEKLFGFQYAVEMNMPSGRSTAWVKRLPEVVSALNNEVTRLIGKKPAVAIREKAVSAKPATTYMRPIGENERKLPLYAHVRYLYYPGELEGGGRRATDPIWSLKVFKIQKVVTKPDSPVVYYILDGPKTRVCSRGVDGRAAGDGIAAANCALDKCFKASICSCVKPHTVV